MSVPDIQGGEHLKPDTVEVLKELESEGHTIEGQEPKVEEPKVEQPKVEEPQKPEVELKTEPAKAEAEPKPAKVEREVQAVPVKKYNEERHKRQEAEKRAADLEAQMKAGTAKAELPADLSGAAEALGKKWGLEPEFVSELLDTATKLTPKNTANLSDKEIADLRQAKALIDQQAEQAAFTADFDKVSKALADDGFDITGHKDKIKELAYTEGYTSTSLRAIALEYAHDNGLLTKGRKTLEKGSAGRTVTTEAIDFDSLSEEQAKALPDDQWEKYVEHQITKQKRAQGIKN